MAPTDLPDDLRDAVAALVERANVCHLVDLADLDAALPARPLSRAEVERLLAVLADHGLNVIEPDAAERLVAAKP